MNTKLSALLLTVFTVLIPFTPKADADFPDERYVEGCEELGENCGRIIKSVNEWANWNKQNAENNRANDPNNCSGKGCSTVGGYRHSQKLVKTGGITG